MGPLELDLIRQEIEFRKNNGISIKEPENQYYDKENTYWY